MRVRGALMNLPGKKMEVKGAFPEVVRFIRHQNS
jgi:hypothetical protein